MERLITTLTKLSTTLTNRLFMVCTPLGAALLVKQCELRLSLLLSMQLPKHEGLPLKSLPKLLTSTQMPTLDPEFWVELLFVHLKEQLPLLHPLRKLIPRFRS